MGFERIWWDLSRIWGEIWEFNGITGALRGFNVIKGDLGDLTGY